MSDKEKNKNEKKENEKNEEKKNTVLVQLFPKSITFNPKFEKKWLKVGNLEFIDSNLDDLISSAFILKETLVVYLKRGKTPLKVLVNPDKHLTVDVYQNGIIVKRIQSIRINEDLEIKNIIFVYKKPQAKKQYKKRWYR